MEKINIDKIIEESGFNGVGAKAKSNLKTAIENAISETINAYYKEEKIRFDQYVSEQKSRLNEKEADIMKIQEKVKNEFLKLNYMKKKIFDIARDSKELERIINE